MVKSEKLKDKGHGEKRVFRLMLSHPVFAILLLAFGFSLFTDASAQDDPIEAAPPPLKLVSKEESARLGAKTDIKDRTKLSLELMALRVAAAERSAAGKQFEDMYRELGYFHGLMDDALDFLKRRDNGSGKILDNYKRLEIGLRGMAPKIEVIRRELPLRYDPYVRKLMGYLRNVRAKATDSLFDDTVVPVKKPDPPEL